MARSLTKEQVDVGSTAAPSPRFTITDIVTGTRWFISINFLFDGSSYFEEPHSSDYQRMPTIEEVRSLGQLLTLQPEILTFAWEFGDTVTIVTSDHVENVGAIVSYRFDGVKRIDESLSTDSASNLHRTSISLATFGEIEPALVRKSALSAAHPHESKLFEKFRAKAVVGGA